MPYTTKEVADRLKISKPTLLRWIREGFIQDVVKDGRHWRVWTDGDLESVRRFIEAYQQGKVDKDKVRAQKVRAYEEFSKRRKYTQRQKVARVP